MDQKTIKKYPGNTLVEMMTALAITSFATTLGLVIYLNIQESTRPFFKLKASTMAGKCLEETIKDRSYFDQEFEEDGLKVKKKVIRNVVYADCNDLSIKITDNEGKALLEVNATLHVAE